MREVNIYTRPDDRIIQYIRQYSVAVHGAVTSLVHSSKTHRYYNMHYVFASEVRRVNRLGIKKR